MDFKYFAFISFSSHDMRWGHIVQRKLESYRLPAVLCNEHGWSRKPMKPVFFAPTDIQPGGLDSELKARLEAAQHLIVICSPHSARSQWVGMEIDYFHSLGRTENIHFFIVDGVPHSGHEDTECFNPVLAELGLPEILGANIHERVYRLGWLNRERAFVQLITKLLGVEFDTLWQRHKRHLAAKVAAISLTLLAVVAALLLTWRMNQPFTVEVALFEAPPYASHLPQPTNANLTLLLDNETKTCTLEGFSQCAVFQNLPHSVLGSDIHITASCQGFLPLDTVVSLGRQHRLAMRRDPLAFGTIHFTLWNNQDECPAANIPVSVAGILAMSNEEGLVELHIPLEQQALDYTVGSEVVELIDTIIAVPHTEEQTVRIKQPKHP